MHSITFKVFLLTLVSAAQAGFAHDSNKAISCVSEQSEPIIVELWSPSKFEDPIHCVSGDFIADMTPCAPDGGWGLSRGTGGADLVELTQSWKVAYDHPSGKIFGRVGPQRINFSASHGEGLPGSVAQWTLEIDRVSGQAVLEIADRGATYYQCALLERRF